MFIPFSFLPFKTVLALSKKIKTTGRFASAFFPQLRETLLQAEIDLPSQEYSAIALASALGNASLLLLLSIAVTVVTQVNLVLAGIAASFLLFFATFFTILYHPKIVAMKRSREIDSQLIPAVRQMLIAIRSGVPLYNTMASLTLDYGETSNEFRKIVKKINSGVNELDALSDATAETPSQQFRKLLWQVSNALKVGSDVGNVLEALNQEYTKERIDQVRRYGQELSPFSMVYMMFAIILPSLGITMLIVITSFLTVPVPPITLMLLFVVLVLFQLFFLNLISTRRPLV